MSVPYTYILVEQDGQQEKIPYTEFANNFIQYVPEPLSPETDGQQGQMAVNNWDIVSGGESISSSVFVYSNNAWRKIPTYTTNWDDIEPVDNEDGTFTYLRFLPIHKQVTLTEKELDNVYKTLDITVATNAKLGLVKGTNDFSENFGTITIEEDGSLKVASATSTHQGTVQLFDEYGDELGEVYPIVYTKQAIDRKFTKAGALTIPAATYETRGGIIVGPNMSVTENGLLSINTATVQEENNPLGLVKYAPISFTDSQNIENEDYIDESSYTLSAGQSRALIKHYVNKIQEQARFELRPATSVTLGGVLVDSNNTNIQISGEGLINVKDATTDRAGAVKYLTSFDDINNQTEGVPTIYTIKQYVDSKVSQNLPVATTTTAGAVIIGQGLKVNSDGVVDVNLPLATIDQRGLVYTTQTITEENKSHAYVPTSEGVYNFVTSLIGQPETPLVPSASSTKAGVVTVQPAATDVKENNTYKVPTVQYVRDYVSDAIESTNNEQEVAVSSKQWLVVGTGNFDVDILKQTVLANQEILVSAITGSSTQEQAFILPAGLNILVFQNPITAEKLNSILSSLSLEVGTYQNSCANNFILIPGEGIFGYYLQNGLTQQ